MVDWATNGGIYLGRNVAAPAKVALAQQAELPSDELLNQPTEDEPLRGVWREAAGFRRYTGDRHIFTLGPNGSGKTRLLLLPNLVMLRDWSILVVDPKGSLAAQTAAYRASRPGHTVRIFDPFDVLATSFPEVVKGNPVFRNRGFNPLAKIERDSSRFNDDVANLARAIISDTGLNEKHWAQSARALVKGLLMAFRADGIHPHFSFLRAVLGLPANRVADECKDAIKKHGRQYPAITAALSRFTQIDDNKELMSILSTAQTQTEWLDSESIKKNLADNDPSFTFEQMKERPTTVYLVLPPEELETQGTWLRLMVAAALRPMLRSVAPARVPVLFMLDEFAQLGHMEIIEKNLGLMREYGVKLWPILQDLGQMKDIYERRWESFIANAGVLHAFAPQDVTTRDYLSKLSGERLYWVATRNRQGGTQVAGDRGVGISSGWSETTQNYRAAVYLPQHLASIPFGKGVVFEGGRSDRVSFPQPESLDDVAAAMRYMLQGDPGRGITAMPKSSQRPRLT